MRTFLLNGPLAENIQHLSNFIKGFIVLTFSLTAWIIPGYVFVCLFPSFSLNVFQLECNEEVLGCTFKYILLYLLWLPWNVFLAICLVISTITWNSTLDYCIQTQRRLESYKNV